jgi:SulP family sulfate permease
MVDLKKYLPFLRWFPVNTPTLRADIVAGVTVALVLIPQSMAYAQLAGLPAFYGLYAAFLPPIVAVAFGSSHQLATGPVAIVSLLTAAALEPIAVAGGEMYVVYAVLLALMVGIFQILLGMLRMGALVNFLSHSVVVGFTNAAAIIIATSQLGKLFGVTVDKAPQHYQTVWNTMLATTDTHWPTLVLGVLAFTIVLVLRRINPRIPNVLVAVAVTTLISWVIGFEKKQEITVSQLGSESVRNLIKEQLDLSRQIEATDKQMRLAENNWLTIKKEIGEDTERTLKALHEVDQLKLKLQGLKNAKKTDIREIKSLHLQRVAAESGNEDRYYLVSDIPAEVFKNPEESKTDNEVWRVLSIDEQGKLLINAGGAVVGNIPPGLPDFRFPSFDFTVFLQLLGSAIAISLIGFMEAISIAKAMAARTRQHLDANQELIGQGLANTVGSLFQSYPVSGSFSRSAVNIDAGAVTGLSSVVTGLVVLIALLLFTPLLYHLPQATLAAVIMVAVIGLVSVRAFKRVWQVQPNDGLVATITFVLTLLLAPHLEQAIIVGILLSLGIYLYRTMKPRVAVLARHPDGSLRDAEVHGLTTCENISVIRFDGSLYFANTSYFEDKIMLKLAIKPELKYVIVDAEGMNQLDATGEEMLVQLTERLSSTGIEVLFARVKQQIMEVLVRAGFVEQFGDWRFFRRTEHALEYAWEKLGENHKNTCPLHLSNPINPKKDTTEMVSESD